MEFLDIIKLSIKNNLFKNKRKMKLTIVTGCQGIGKSYLINKMTEGLIQAKFSAVVLTTIINDEIPDFLLFEGLYDLPKIAKIIKKGKIYWRKPFVKKYIPIPDIYLELNENPDSIPFSIEWGDMLKTKGLETLHIHLQKITIK